VPDQGSPAAAPLVEAAQAAADTALDRDVFDQLREDLGGPAPLCDLITTFLEKTPPVLTALRDAAVRADVGEIRRTAHMLKGTSAMLGGRALAEQCAELERLGRAGVVGDAVARATAVEASYRKLEAALTVAVESFRQTPGFRQTP
jgi:HPt (histidine-containing phosphotransfer) domain-containing protein